MLMRLNLGAEVDIATGQELEDGLAGLGEKLGKKGPRPLYLSFSGSRLGPGLIVLGSPPSGRLWNLLTVTLVGSDDSATVANARVALYVDSQEGSLTLSNCRVPGLVVPSYDTFSMGTFWAHANGSVIANVSGTVAADAQVTCSISVAEWREGDIMDNDPGRY